MAVVAMQKIKLVALKKDEQKILKILQKKGVMEMTEIENSFIEERDYLDKLHKLELDIANLDFCIKLIKRYETPRSLLEGPLMFTEEEIETRGQDYKFDHILKNCQRIEEGIVNNNNLLAALEAEQAELEPWTNLKYSLDSLEGSEKVNVLIGIILNNDIFEFTKEFEKLSNLQQIDIIDKTKTHTYLGLIFEKSLTDKVKELISKYKFSINDLPKEKGSVKERLKEIKEQSSQARKEISELEKELKNLAEEAENLKIAHDYLIWQRDSIATKENFNNTEYCFAITGWIPLNQLEKLEKDIKKETKNYELSAMAKKENEEEPVAIHNNRFFWPFESVTKIYGLPLASEVDPTPFLAAFFIIFFGLCLTDAGYGLVLFLLTFAALKWIKIPKQSQGLIKLIMWGGIVTFVAGIFFGGWFGMTPDQAPGFLTYDNVTESIKTIDGSKVTTTVTSKEFKWQLINPSKGNGPLMFLILSGVLGVIQVLFGIAVNGYWKLKHKQYVDALLDSGLWLYFLISILLFAISKMGVFLPEMAQVFTYMTLIGVGLLILTQGRKKKNIVLKFASGVLSLYGLVGYLADVLSYSRLMALGLGTGIIGFAMNTMAGLVIGVPYIGIIFAIIVILIGHTLNIAISTLGAFIHSSRLQFVEFFGKFMEGGGREFKPFQKNCKYIYIKN